MTEIIPVVVGKVIGDLLGGILKGGKGGDLQFVDFIDSLKGGLDAVGQWLTDRIFDSTAQVEGVIGAAEQAILAEIGDLDFATAGDLNAAKQTILETIIQAAILGNDANKRQEGRITDAILVAAENTDTVLGDLVLASTRPILVGNNTILDTVSDLQLGFNTAIGGISFDIAGILEILKGGLQTIIRNEIIIPSGVFEVITGRITEALTIVAGEHEITLKIFDKIINETLTDALDLGNVIDVERLDQLTRLADLFAGVMPKEAAVLDAALEPGKGGFGHTFGDGYWGVLGEKIQGALPNVLEKVGRVLRDGPLPDRAEPDCEGTQYEIGLLEQTGDSLVDWLVGLIVVGMIPLNAAQIRASRNMQNYRVCFPDQLLQPGDLIQATRRGYLDDSEARFDLRKQGYSKRDATLIMSMANEFPAIEYLFALHLRGLISDEVFEYALGAHGFLDGWADVMKALEFFIPPAQDLITMAVREVFDPAVAAANGQFEDFPPDFAKYAAMQGISEEWAQNYWAAHWRLPSEQMGFEMLHRRIIDEPQLKGLMKALDVMPAWRDRLIAISYNPLTRVDIRRMNALGVLDDNETLNAYLDVGYNPENAARLLEFTKRLNQEESLLTLDVASDLTRSNIIGFYKDGILDAITARLLLLQAGVNVAAAELFIMAADFDIERQERKDQITLILDKYRFGKITFEAAVDQVRALDIEAKEKELALLDLERISDQINKLPSRTDLDKFLKAGLIGDSQYLDTMEKIGFNFTWAEKYLSLAQSAGATDAG